MKRSIDAPRIDLVTGTDKFMIGTYISDLAGIKYFDLANGPQIFDITAYHGIYNS